MAVRVDTDGADFKPGNPEHIVLGKPDEKPAKKHGRQRARPVTAMTILTDIKFRRHMLQPLVDEYRQLEKANKALEGI